MKYDQCDFVHDSKMTTGAPDLDRIVVRRGDAVVFSSEAEAPQNHIGGLARIEERSRCGGEKCVAGIGLDGGAVEIPDVSVPDAGRYTLEVHFLRPYYGQNRDHFKEMTLFVGVNGGERSRLTAPYQIAQRYTTGSVTIDVELKQGVNRIVLDNPSSQEEDVRLAYFKMSAALARAGRDVMFSSSGAPRPWLWAAPVAHLWRTSGDLNDQWSGGNTSILATVDREIDTLRYAGPGFWADPDALQVGLRGHQPQFGNAYKGMNDTEYRSHFSLWAILNAPLFISTDLRNADETTLKILLNRDVIAVNQDPLGSPAVRLRTLRRDGHDVDAFVKRVSDGFAVLLVNRESEATDVHASLADLAIDDPRQKDQPWQAHNLWSGEKQPLTEASMSARIDGHGVAMFRLRRDTVSRPASFRG
jgi:alpha-galactosidase